VALVSIVIEPFGVFIVPLWTVQKNGMTVPLGAFEGSAKLLVPMKGPVSNEIPATEPSVKAFAFASLVTEWSIPSSLTTVTVAPGGACRFSGEKLMLKMVMKKPVAGADGAAGELDPPQPAAKMVARATTPVLTFRHMNSPPGIVRGCERIR